MNEKKTWDDGSYEAFENNFKKKWSKLFKILFFGLNVL